jgi:DNA-binding GntR family transcriptional regulator
MPVSPLLMTEATGLAGKIYEDLRGAIISGRLLPGSPLSRRRVAEEFGVSTIPVGDALARLEAEGLVESRSRAGTRVRIATPEDIHGNYVLREALETHSARLFAESASPRYRARLPAAAEKLDSAYNALARARRTSAATERQARIERVHIAFHMLVAEATEVPVLIAAIERSRVLLFNQIFTVSTDFEPFPERWHRDLAQALAEGTPEQAAEAMRVHVRYRQEEVIKTFRKLAEAAAAEPRMVRGPQRRPAEAGA